MSDPLLDFGGQSQVIEGIPACYYTNVAALNNKLFSALLLARVRPEAIKRSQGTELGVAGGKAGM